MLKILLGVFYFYGVLFVFKDFKFEKGELFGLGDLLFLIKKFNGLIGQFFEMVLLIYDILFEYVGGSMLKVFNLLKYMILFLQVDNVFEFVVENIEVLGVENIKINIFVGFVVYEVLYCENRDICNFMFCFYENYVGVKF